MVTNLFAKILKPTRKEQAVEAMDRTIAFREYAHLEGVLELAFKTGEQEIQGLKKLLPQINYFGKRGCFFQLVTGPKLIKDFPKGFIFLDGVYIQNNRVQGRKKDPYVLGIVKMMDDWGEDLTF